MSPRPIGGGYRPALDGMRAVSVLTIMMFHVPYKWVTGGYWSVNVFFIVSGYLITGLLLKELDKWGSIDLVGFYMRRARRLLPALLIMLVVVSVVWPRILGDKTPGTIRGDGLAALFYVANWRMVLTGQSYFEQFGTVAQSPFKHAWTLGIEEQYYLLFPLLMIAMFRLFGRRGRGKMLAVIVALAGISAIAMAKVYVPGGDPSRVYYGTDTRMQDILVGAALAIGMSMIDPRRLSAWARRNRTAVVAVGWLVAGLSLYWFFFIPAGGWVFYGGYLVFDTMFALLIVSVELVRSSSIAAVLSWRPVAWIGMMSYGLYLWHYPLFVLLTPDRTHLDGIPLQIVRFGLTFVIASASYYFVEDPIRKGALRKLGRRISRAVPLAAVAATAVVIGVSVNGMRLAPAARAGSNTVVSGTGDGHYRLLIIGDSVGFSLGYNFPQQVFPDIKPTADVDFGCGTAVQQIVVQGKRQAPQKECKDIFMHWSEGVASTNPNVIVWSLGPWEVYDHYVDDKTLKVGSSAYASYLTSRLKTGLSTIRKTGSKAPIVIPQVPCLGQPKYVVDGVNMAPERNDPKRAAAVNTILQSFAAKHHDVHLVDTGRLLCPSGKFTEKVNGVKMRDDGVHYTKAGATAFWKWIMPQIAKWVPHTPKAKE